MFAEVILPVKFHGIILYNVPEDLVLVSDTCKDVHTSACASANKSVAAPEGGLAIADVCAKDKVSVNESMAAPESRLANADVCRKGCASGNETANELTNSVAQIKEGAWVKVEFGKAKYAGVVRRFHRTNELDTVHKLRDISMVLDIPPVPETQMSFWEKIAEYYLCTVGEVMKAAIPNMIRFADLEHAQEDSRNTFSEYCESLKCRRPELSEPQKEAYTGILASFREGRRVLLEGVTGSGKTEIYISLAIDTMLSGKSVLMLEPEISLSKQLNARLKSVFGSRLLLYNSKVTPARKARVQESLSRGQGPFFVLGTRSALLLPFRELGLIVVDEEHDNSYKQEDPAPRYNARDAAIMLSALPSAQDKHINLLLGSATPSYESLYNVKLGKLSLVNLKEKYYGTSGNGADPGTGTCKNSSKADSEITLIDTLYARRTHQMKGSFSQQLINKIRKVTDDGQQVLVLKNRRSYAPMVECSECGEPAVCPHCNVMLSYHKSDNTLRCHYCEYSRPFEKKCRKCGSESMVPKGTGTEKIEEELEQLFPELSIGRFDADITKSKREEEKILSAFDSGEIKILTGTQMITKGFDFKGLKLVAVLGAEQILGLQDFRADEKAFQMFYQLLGRAGRRGQGGELVIQTTWKDHPVLSRLKDVCNNNMITAQEEMSQRRDFLFPPYSRLVKIIARGFTEESAEALAQEIRDVLDRIPSLELTGPFNPQIDRLRGVHLKCFYIKFARNKDLASNKRRLYESLRGYVDKGRLIIDVDPL